MFPILKWQRVMPASGAPPTPLRGKLQREPLVLTSQSPVEAEFSKETIKWSECLHAGAEYIPCICRPRVNVSAVIGTLDASPLRCLGFLQHASQ